MDIDFIAFFYLMRTNLFLFIISLFSTSFFLSICISTIKSSLSLIRLLVFGFPFLGIGIVILGISFLIYFNNK